MLRIRTIDEPRTVRLKLEGKVIREWIPEARRVWMEVSNGKEMVIDLLDVTFVDDWGRKLLTEMHASGACLVGCGPMIGGLLEEIQREKPSSESSRFWKMLLFLIGC